MKKKGIIALIVLGTIIAWKLADYLICKPEDPIIEIPMASYASMYGDGYNCGWNDSMENKNYDPSEAANRFYGELDNDIYRKIAIEYAAAFSAGYGFGYSDYSTGKQNNRNGYLKWESDSEYE